MKKFAGRIKKGFTTAEVLIAVAILAVLFAVGTPLVFQLQKNLKLKELDDCARQIYLAAQNQLTAVDAAGELDQVANKVSGESLTDGNEEYTVDWFEKDKLASLIQPGSVEANVAANSYSAKIDFNTATVLEVLYSEVTGDGKGKNLTKDNSKEDYSDEATGSQNKRKSDYVGQYDSDDITTVNEKGEKVPVERSKLKYLPVSLAVKDNEGEDGTPDGKLRLEITVGNITTGKFQEILDNNDVNLAVTIQELTADGEVVDAKLSSGKTVKLSKDFLTSKTITKDKRTQSITLDDLLGYNNDNKETFQEFLNNHKSADSKNGITPGADIKITVTASIDTPQKDASGKTSNYGLLSTKTSIITNPLFASINCNGETKDGAGNPVEDVTEYQIFVSNPRHLQNLNAATSGVNMNAITANAANDARPQPVLIPSDTKWTVFQTADIDWNETKNYPDQTAAADFCPIVPTSTVVTSAGTNTVTYVAGYISTKVEKKNESGVALPEKDYAAISNLNIKGGQTYDGSRSSGLFAGLIGTSSAKAVLKNISLIKPVQNGEAVYAGTLAGNARFVKVENCKVINPVQTLTGTGGSYGGMIGKLADGEVSGSQLYMQLPEALKEAEVKDKVAFYKDFILKVNGSGNVGGLIGKADQSSVSVSSASWPVIEVTGNASIGGLIGTATGKASGAEYTLLRSYADTGLCTEKEKNGRTITDWYEKCGIIADSAKDTYAGGLIGKVDTVSAGNCYAMGYIASAAVGGGFAGENRNTTLTVDSCYTFVDMAVIKNPAAGADTGKQVLSRFSFTPENASVAPAGNGYRFWRAGKFGDIAADPACAVNGVGTKFFTCFSDAECKNIMDTAKEFFGVEDSTAPVKGTNYWQRVLEGTGAPSASPYGINDTEEPFRFMQLSYKKADGTTAYLQHYGDWPCNTTHEMTLPAPDVNIVDDVTGNTLYAEVTVTLPTKKEDIVGPEALADWEDFYDDYYTAAGSKGALMNLVVAVEEIDKDGNTVKYTAKNGKEKERTVYFIGKAGTGTGDHVYYKENNNIILVPYTGENEVITTVDTANPNEAVVEIPNATTFYYDYNKTTKTGKSTFRLYLDYLTDDPTGHFNSICAGFKPGSNIRVTAALIACAENDGYEFNPLSHTVTVKEKKVNEKTGKEEEVDVEKDVNDSVCTDIYNSLFSYTKPGKEEITAAQKAEVARVKAEAAKKDPAAELTASEIAIANVNGRKIAVNAKIASNPVKTANISSARHLQNLDVNTSAVGTGVEKAVQQSSIDWSTAKDPLNNKAGLNFSTILNSTLNNYNGSDKSISNLKITAYAVQPTEKEEVTDNSLYAGLFGKIADGCTITNLSLINPTMTLSREESDTSESVAVKYAGGLIAKAKNATIKNCQLYYVPEKKEDTIVNDPTNTRYVLDSRARYVGGLIGYCEGGTVEMSSASWPKITGKAVIKDNVTFGSSGGLAGFASGTSFSKCYADTGYLYWRADGTDAQIGWRWQYGLASINGVAGGLVGCALDAEFQNCYAMGEIMGDELTDPEIKTTAGGFVGTGSFKANNCYTYVEMDTYITLRKGFTAGTLKDGSADLKYWKLGNCIDGMAETLNPAPVDKNWLAKDLAWSGWENKAKKHPYNDITFIKDENNIESFFFSIAGLPHYGDWSTGSKYTVTVHYEDFDYKDDKELDELATEDKPYTVPDLEHGPFKERNYKPGDTITIEIGNDPNRYTVVPYSNKLIIEHLDPETGGVKSTEIKPIDDPSSPVEWEKKSTEPEKHDLTLKEGKIVGDVEITVTKGRYNLNYDLKLPNESEMSKVSWPYSAIKDGLEKKTDKGYVRENIEFGTVVDLYEPTRDGYKFTGWYDSKGNRIEKDEATEKAHVKFTADSVPEGQAEVQDVTVYAGWTDKDDKGEDIVTHSVEVYNDIASPMYTSWPVHNTLWRSTNEGLDPVYKLVLDGTNKLTPDMVTVITPDGIQEGHEARNTVNPAAKDSDVLDADPGFYYTYDLEGGNVKTIYIPHVTDDTVIVLKQFVTVFDMNRKYHTGNPELVDPESQGIKSLGTEENRIYFKLQKKEESEVVTFRNLPDVNYTAPDAQDYKFEDKWSVDRDGNDPTYSVGGTYETTSYKNTLYAVWSTPEYTITYVLDDGWIGDYKEATKTEKYTINDVRGGNRIVFPAVEKQNSAAGEYYVYNGWYRKPNGKPLRPTYFIDGTVKKEEEVSNNGYKLENSSHENVYDSDTERFFGDLTLYVRLDPKFIYQSIDKENGSTTGKGELNWVPATSEHGTSLSQTKKPLKTDGADTVPAGVVATVSTDGTTNRYHFEAWMDYYRIEPIVSGVTIQFQNADNSIEAAVPGETFYAKNDNTGKYEISEAYRTKISAGGKILSATLTPKRNADDLYEAKTYKACFAKDTYQIKFNANGATVCTLKDRTYSAGEEVLLPGESNELKRDNYVLVGWNTQPDGTGTNYELGETYEDLGNHNGEVVELYAQWKLKQNRITFNYGDDSTNPAQNKIKDVLGQSENSLDVTYGDNIIETYKDALKNKSEADRQKYIKALEEPQRNGYIFKGWYTNDKFTGNPFDLNKDITDPMTLYAKWVKSITVKFNLNGGTGTGDYSDQIVEDGKKVTSRPNPDPTKTGCTFAGWYNDDYTGTDKEWKFGSDVVTTTAGARGSAKDGVLTLTAHWEKVMCTVTFDKKNVNAILNGKSQISVPYGTMLTTKDWPSAAMEGNNWEGWFNNDRGTEVKIENYGAITSNVTFYAKWNQRPKVTFVIWDTAKYKTEPDTRWVGYTDNIVGTNKKLSETIEDPQMPGVHFAGWYKNSTIGEKKTISAYKSIQWNEKDKVDIANTEFNEDTKLYARWTVEFTILSINKWGTKKTEYPTSGNKLIDLYSAVSIYNKSYVAAVGNNCEIRFFRDNNQANSSTSYNVESLGQLNLRDVWPTDVHFPVSRSLGNSSMLQAQIIKETRDSSYDIVYKPVKDINSAYFHGIVWGKAAIGDFKWVSGIYFRELDCDTTITLEYGTGIDEFDVNFYLDKAKKNHYAVKKVIQNAYCPAIEDPEIEYQFFNGWYDDNGKGPWKFSNDPNPSGYEIKKHTDLIASWEDGYTIKYVEDENGNKGEPWPSDPATVRSGQAVVAGPTLSLSGYTFGGWATPNGTIWDFDNAVSSSTELDTNRVLKLHPVWVQKSDTGKVNVYFITDHGKTPEPKLVKEGSTIPYTDDLKLTADYYYFDGWYKDSSKTVKWDFANDKAKSASTTDNSMYLYAKWIAVPGIRYDLTSNAECIYDAAFEGLKSATPKTGSETEFTYKITGNNPSIGTEDNPKFNYWYVQGTNRLGQGVKDKTYNLVFDSSATSVTVDSSGVIHVPASAKQTPVVLTPYWTVSAVIHWNNGNPEVKTELKEQEYNKPLPNLDDRRPENTKEWELKGWSTEPDGPVVYTDIEDVKPTRNTELYAVWDKRNNFYITYNAEDYTGGSMTPDSYDVDKNSDDTPATYPRTINLSTNGFTRNGFTFSNWIDRENPHLYVQGDNHTYTPGTNYYVIFANKPSVGYQLNLYAEWSANSYTAHFDANFGTLSGGNTDTFNALKKNETAKDASGNTVSCNPLTLPIPTRDNYLFEGWEVVERPDKAAYGEDTYWYGKVGYVPESTAVIGNYGEIYGAYGDVWFRAIWKALPQIEVKIYGDELDGNTPATSDGISRTNKLTADISIPVFANLPAGADYTIDVKVYALDSSGNITGDGQPISKDINGKTFYNTSNPSGEIRYSPKEGLTFTILLDSLSSNSSNRFHSICPDISAGSNIAVECNLTAKYKGGSTVKTNDLNSSDGKTNSLFAYDHASTAVNNVAEARIAGPRHLQNLDTEFSGINNSTGYATAANQLVDIDWNNAIVDGASAGYKPVTNSGLTAYKGNSRTISNINYNEATGNAGLFDTVSGSTAVNNLTLSNCTFKADVAGTLAGKVESGKTLTVEKVVLNNCTVEANTADDAFAGGIAGFVEGTLELKDKVTLKNFSIQANEGSEETAAGGIAGKVSGTISFVKGSRTEILRNPEDTDGQYSVKASGTEASAGGIAGHATAFQTVTDVDVYIVGVGVSGKNAGSVFGKTDAGATVENVLAKAGEAVVKGSGNAGGLVGTNGNGMLTVKNSSASVFVESSEGNAGGLIGSSTGEVEITKSFAGGHVITVAGKIVYDTSSVESYNIYGKETAGGLIGVIETGKLKIEESFSSASVAAALNKSSIAGGIIGHLNNSAAELTKVYVLGPVNAVGMSPSDTSNNEVGTGYNRKHAGFIGSVSDAYKASPVANTDCFYLAEVYDGFSYFTLPNGEDTTTVAYIGGGYDPREAKPDVLSNRIGLVYYQSTGEIASTIRTDRSAVITVGTFNTELAKYDYPYRIWTKSNLPNAETGTFAFYGDWQPVLNPPNAPIKLTFLYHHPGTGRNINDGITSKLREIEIIRDRKNSVVVPSTPDYKRYVSNGWDLYEKNGTEYQLLKHYTEEVDGNNKSTGIVTIDEEYCNQHLYLIKSYKLNQEADNQHTIFFMYNPDPSKTLDRSDYKDLYQLAVDDKTPYSEVCDPESGYYEKTILKYYFVGWTDKDGNLIDFTDTTKSVDSNMVVYALYSPNQYEEITVDFYYKIGNEKTKDVVGISRIEGSESRYTIVKPTGTRLEKKINVPVFSRYKITQIYAFNNDAKDKTNTITESIPFESTDGIMTQKATATLDLRTKSSFSVIYCVEPQDPFILKYVLENTDGDMKYSAEGSKTFYYTGKSADDCVSTSKEDSKVFYSVNGIAEVPDISNFTPTGFYTNSTTRQYLWDDEKKDYATEKIVIDGEERECRIVQLQYKRNRYVLQYDYDGGTPMKDGDGKPIYTKLFTYGEKITIESPKAQELEKTGYTFGSWTLTEKESGKSYSYRDGVTMPASKVTAKANWTPGTADFTVVYMFQNPDPKYGVHDNGYSYFKSYTVKDVRTDTTVTTAGYNNLFNTAEDIAEAKNFTYVDPPSDVKGYTGSMKVKGDGSTVLTVYFNRKIYSVKWIDTSNSAKSKTIEAKYGTDVSEQWPTTAGGDNTSWKVGSRNSSIYQANIGILDKNYTFYSTSQGNAMGYYYLEMLDTDTSKPDLEYTYGGTKHRYKLDHTDTGFGTDFYITTDDAYPIEGYTFQIVVTRRDSTATYSQIDRNSYSYNGSKFLYLRNERNLDVAIGYPTVTVPAGGLYSEQIQYQENLIGFNSDEKKAAIARYYNIDTEHYRFENWYSDETMEPGAVFSFGTDTNPKLMPDNALKVYGKWRGVPVKVTLRLNDGSEFPDGETEHTLADTYYNETVETQLAASENKPLKENYTFTYWKLEDGTAFSDKQPVTSDIVLIPAGWVSDMVTEPRTVEVRHYREGDTNPVIVDTIEGHYIGETIRINSYDVKSEDYPEVLKGYYQRLAGVDHIIDNKTDPNVVDLYYDLQQGWNYTLQYDITYKTDATVLANIKDTEAVTKLLEKTAKEFGVDHFTMEEHTYLLSRETDKKALNQYEVVEATLPKGLEEYDITGYTVTYNERIQDPEYPDDPTRTILKPATPEEGNANVVAISVPLSCLSSREADVTVTFHIAPKEGGMAIGNQEETYDGGNYNKRLNKVGTEVNGSGDETEITSIQAYIFSKTRPDSATGKEVDAINAQMYFINGYYVVFVDYFENNVPGKALYLMSKAEAEDNPELNLRVHKRTYTFRSKSKAQVFKESDLVDCDSVYITGDVRDQAYNGKEISYSMKEGGQDISSKYFPDGEGFDIHSSVEAFRRSPGSMDNIFKVTARAGTSEDNYNIITEYGKLTVYYWQYEVEVYYVDDEETPLKSCLFREGTVRNAFEQGATEFFYSELAEEFNELAGKYIVDHSQTYTRFYSDSTYTTTTRADEPDPNGRGETDSIRLEPLAQGAEGYKVVKIYVSDAPLQVQMPMPMMFAMALAPSEGNEEENALPALTLESTDVTNIDGLLLTDPEAEKSEEGTEENADGTATEGTEETVTEGTEETVTEGTEETATEGTEETATEGTEETATEGTEETATEGAEETVTEGTEETVTEGTEETAAEGTESEEEISEDGSAAELENLKVEKCTLDDAETLAAIFLEETNTVEPALKYQDDLTALFVHELAEQELRNIEHPEEAVDTSMMKEPLKFPADGSLYLRIQGVDPKYDLYVLNDVSPIRVTYIKIDNVAYLKLDLENGTEETDIVRSVMLCADDKDVNGDSVLVIGPSFDVQVLASPDESTASSEGTSGTQPVETVPEAQPVEPEQEAQPVETAPEAQPAETAPEAQPAETAPEAQPEEPATETSPAEPVWTPEVIQC